MKCVSSNPKLWSGLDCKANARELLLWAKDEDKLYRKSSSSGKKDFIVHRVASTVEYINIIISSSINSSNRGTRWIIYY